jgi:hypothetical protein
MWSPWSPPPPPVQPKPGQIYIDHESDLQDLSENNGMLNGTVTTAYLDVLVRQYHGMGVRRSSDVFVPIVYYAHKENGTQDGFHTAVATMKSMETGCHVIDWETDPIIFLQIFRGDPGCGTWSLAILDRTVTKKSTVVLFDSMPTRFPDTLDKLKEWLGESPLSENECKWITADMPIQESNSNDCGVWMCCVASLYLKHILKQYLLPTSKNGWTEGISRVTVVSAKNVTEIGRLGRIHMMETITTDDCRLDQVFFDYLQMTICRD